MKRILEGVLEFQRKTFPAKREIFERLAAGQHPEALLITCADSRIQASAITHTEPGDLFIVRNVGNLVPMYGDSDPSVSAAVEYALEVLSVQHIIVCGHSHCGAMHALLQPKGLEKVPAVGKWLKRAGALRRPEGPNALNELIEQNVLTQISHLRTYPSVARLEQAQDLTLHAWVYDIPSGVVREWNQENGKFEPVRPREAGTGDQAARAGRREAQPTEASAR
jgi:carbonic anhydrase